MRMGWMLFWMAAVLGVACSGVEDGSELGTNQSEVKKPPTHIGACTCYTAVFATDGSVTVGLSPTADPACKEIGFVMVQLACEAVTDALANLGGEVHGAANLEPNTETCGVKFEGEALAGTLPSTGLTIQAVLVKSGREYCSLASSTDPG